ncbi:MAG: hypothetical protein DRJ62_02790 [Thermoprotei archaeon]|nr:MAG: hypothetical protein DRJ62_02790 [Thermoprotei archaeon]
MLSDKFTSLAELVKKRIEGLGGRASFKELAEWAKNSEVGSVFVLYAIVKDLLERRELTAPEGFEEMPDLMMWEAPKVVALPTAETKAEAKAEVEAEVKGEEAKPEEAEPAVEAEEAKLTVDLEAVEDEDLRKALEYLSEYWSVGEIRFKLDLKRMGVEDPNKVVLKLMDMGLVDVTPTGVVNAKFKPLKRVKKISLASFV